MAEHGTLPLFRSADSCGHPEPPQPAFGGLCGYDADGRWSEWDADHPKSDDLRERVCLLTPAGSACPVCTDEARDEEDLPEDDYVACRLAGTPAPEGEQ